MRPLPHPLLPQSSAVPTHLELHPDDVHATADSCAYIVLETSAPGLEGTGLAFTIGRGNETVVAAANVRQTHPPPCVQAPHTQQCPTARVHSRSRWSAAARGGSGRGGHAAPRVGWVSMLPLEWLMEAVQPPGSGAPAVRGRADAADDRDRLQDGVAQPDQRWSALLDRPGEGSGTPGRRRDRQRDVGPLGQAERLASRRRDCPSAAPPSLSL